MNTWNRSRSLNTLAPTPMLEAWKIWFQKRQQIAHFNFFYYVFLPAGILSVLAEWLPALGWLGSPSGSARIEETRSVALCILYTISQNQMQFFFCLHHKIEPYWRSNIVKARQTKPTQRSRQVFSLFFRCNYLRPELHWASVLPF